MLEQGKPSDVRHVPRATPHRRRGRGKGPTPATSHRTNQTPVRASYVPAGRMAAATASRLPKARRRALGASGQRRARSVPRNRKGRVSWRERERQKALHAAEHALFGTNVERKLFVEPPGSTGAAAGLPWPAVQPTPPSPAAAQWRLPPANGPLHMDDVAQRVHRARELDAYEMQLDEYRRYLHDHELVSDTLVFK